MIVIYYYIIWPILIALLLDSFSKTVMELGSITDEVKEERLSCKEYLKLRVFVLRPWYVLQEAEEKLKALKMK